MTISEKDKNIIMEFVKTPNYYNYLKDIIRIYDINNKIFNTSLLISFANCIINELIDNRQKALEIILNKIANPNIALVFLYYIHQNITTKLKLSLIGLLYNNMPEAICFNSNKNVYLLNNGKCIQYSILANYLLNTNFNEPIIENNILWTNGYEFKQLIDNITLSNIDFTIKNKLIENYRKYIKDLINNIPSDILSLIKDLYPILNFKLEIPYTIISILEKYKYPQDLKGTLIGIDNNILKNFREKMINQLYIKINSNVDALNTILFISEINNFNTNDLFNADYPIIGNLLKTIIDKTN
jgi:hypothetical protein